MFIQVISGTVNDPTGLRRQWDDWHERLRSGAAGHLGDTAGISPGGRFVALVRFESAHAAATNSDRPEQDEWWAATAPLLDDVRFVDTDDVTTLLGGGSDEAGFVQIIEGSDTDRSELEAMDHLFEQHAPTWRPELLGAVRVWAGPSSYVEAAYFSSEAAARSGESTEPPPELGARMGDFEALLSKADFTDLPNPWII